MIRHGAIASTKRRFLGAAASCVLGLVAGAARAEDFTGFYAGVTVGVARGREPGAARERSDPLPSRDGAGATADGASALPPQRGPGGRPPQGFCFFWSASLTCIIWSKNAVGVVPKKDSAPAKAQ